MAAIYKAHPMFAGADFEFWYPPLGDDDRFRDRGLRPGVARGRRRRDHRQRHGRDRDVRAHDRPDDRADRQGAVRQGRGRARHRRRHDQGPGAHAPRHGVHAARPRQGDGLPARSSTASGRSASDPARPRARSTCARTRTCSSAVADALGVPKLHVVATGGDAYQQEREQWDDGNNVVALEPGRRRRLRAQHVHHREDAQRGRRGHPDRRASSSARVAAAVTA